MERAVCSGAWRAGLPQRSSEMALPQEVAWVSPEAAAFSDIGGDWTQPHVALSASSSTGKAEATYPDTVAPDLGPHAPVAVLRTRTTASTSDSQRHQPSRQVVRALPQLPRLEREPLSPLSLPLAQPQPGVSAEKALLQSLGSPFNHNNTCQRYPDPAMCQVLFWVLGTCLSRKLT